MRHENHFLEIHTKLAPIARTTILGVVASLQLLSGTGMQVLRRYAFVLAFMALFPMDVLCG